MGGGRDEKWFTLSLGVLGYLVVERQHSTNDDLCDDARMVYYSREKVFCYRLPERIDNADPPKPQSVVTERGAPLRVSKKHPRCLRSAPHPNRSGTGANSRNGQRGTSNTYPRLRVRFVRREIQGCFTASSKTHRVIDHASSCVLFGIQNLHWPTVNSLDSESK